MNVSNFSRSNSDDEIKGTVSVPFEMLFSKIFMNMYTNFNSIELLLEKAEQQLQKFDFDDSRFNDFVINNSSFESWDDMLKTASAEYVLKRMNMGL